MLAARSDHGDVFCLFSRTALTATRRSQVLDALIRGGASLSTRDQVRRSRCARIRSRYVCCSLQHGYTALGLASERGSHDIVRRLLRAPGSLNVNRKDGVRACCLSLGAYKHRCSGQFDAIDAGCASRARRGRAVARRSWRRQ